MGTDRGERFPASPECSNICREVYTMSKLMLDPSYINIIYRSIITYVLQGHFRNQHFLHEPSNLDGTYIGHVVEMLEGQA